MKSPAVNGIRQSHGHMTTAVKDTLNTIQVRTILKKQYGIGTKEIKMLDRTGPFKIELLSERRSLMGLFSQAVRTKPAEIQGLKLPPTKDSWVPLEKGLDIPLLPPTAGLILNPRKGSGLPITTITSPGVNLNEAGAEFFAFCVKKAVDMVNVYKKGVKEFSGHAVNQEMNKRFVEVDRHFDNALKNFKSAYINSDAKGLKRASKEMDKIREKEEAINNTFKVDRQLVQNELHANVIDSWQKIQEQPFVPDTKAYKRQAKADSKAQSLARETARANKYTA